MGCSICLEAFCEEDDNASRPACLPCGHLYHLSCAQTWLKTSQRDYCPLCGRTPGKSYQIEQLVPLFPSAPHDLEPIHQAISSDDASWRSALKGATDAEAHKLFDDLTDFNVDLQSWISAIVGVRIVATRRAGERVCRFVKATATDEEMKDEFECTISALHKAIELFGSKASLLDSHFAELDQKRRDLEKDKVRLHEHIDKHKDRLARVAACESSNEKRSAELRERKMKLVTEQKAWAETKRSMELEVKMANEKALESAQSATRAHIEARQTIASKELELKRKRDEADEMVATAYTRQREAEVERDEVKGKNNALADTMRSLQRQLQEQKEAKLEERSKRKKEKEESIRELQILRSRLASAETRLQNQEAASNAQTSMNTCLASSPQHRQVTDDLSADSITSLSIPAQTSCSRKMPMLVDSNATGGDESLSLVVEPRRPGKPSRRSINDGWDSDEADDMPMPGMPRHRGPAASTTTAARGKPLFSSRRPFTSKSNSLDSISLGQASLANDGTSYSRPQGKIRRLDPATEEMSRRFAAGPRQKVKGDIY